MNGNAMTVTGDFSIAGTGTLTENNAADVLIVAGDVSFGGGSTAGRLRTACSRLRKLLPENTTTSFAASGSHQVAFAGASRSRST